MGSVLPDKKTLVWMLATAIVSTGSTWLLSRALAPVASESATQKEMVAGAPDSAGGTGRARGGPRGTRPRGDDGATTSPEDHENAMNPAPARGGPVDDGHIPEESVALSPEDIAALHREGMRNDTTRGPAPSAQPNWDEDEHAFEEFLNTLSPEQAAKVGQMHTDGTAMREELSNLRAENNEMQAKLEEAGLAETPTPEDLAERGEVRFKLNDMALRDQPLSPLAMEDLGLSDAQASAIEDLFRGSSDDLTGDLRSLYSELTGDYDGAGDLGLTGLIDAIRDGSSTEEFSAAVRQVASELAGDPGAADSATNSAAERMLRSILTSDRDLRDQLVDLLGEEMADALLDHPEMKGLDHSYNVGGDGDEGSGGDDGSE